MFEDDDFEEFDVIDLGDGTELLEPRNRTIRRVSRSRRAPRRRPGGGGGGRVSSSRVVSSSRRQPIVVNQPTRPVVSVGGRDLDLGAIIRIGTTALSALQPLPGRPSHEGDAKTDFDNMVKYTESLAQSERRREQVRVIGQLAGELLA